VKWYWPNAILRTLRVNKEKSLFKDPIKIEENLNDQEDNSNEPSNSYAITFADKAQTNSMGKGTNLKSVYQQRLDEFLGNDESGPREKRARNEGEDEDEEEFEDEVSENESRVFKEGDEKRVEEDLSDREEKDDDNEEYEDDGEVTQYFLNQLNFLIIRLWSKNVKKSHHKLNKF
jgi:hypothetical protein